MELGISKWARYFRMMRITRLGVLIGVCALAMLTAGALLDSPWLAKESIFEFTARMAKSKDIGQPDDPANGNQPFPSN